MDYKAFQSIFFCGRMKEGERMRETGEGKGREGKKLGGEKERIK